MTKQPTKDEQVFISEIAMEEMTFCILGESPLVPHAVSAKAKGSLLFPAPKKNAAERASTMKHDPYQEFLDAAYKFRDEDEASTRLFMPAAAFHSAMAQAAIDMAGAKKAQIGRLTTVVGGKIPVFGIPQIWATIVRSSDMARTPDVRILPILPRWACTITVRFVSSLIKHQSIANLLGAAGVIVGVGDGRKEKGKLDMGMFQVVSDDDPAYLAVVKQGGGAAQDIALADPAAVDAETEQLLSWFQEEKNRRVASPTTTQRKKKTNGVPTGPAPTRRDVSRPDLT